MEKNFVRHELLVQGVNSQEAEMHVRSFFAKNELVRYDTIQVDANAVINATTSQFFQRLETGIRKNRQTIKDLIRVLQDEDAADPAQWPTMEQGYATKLLHTTVHLLDGFFGVDTFFYNLLDNSHQVTDTLMHRVKAAPEQYWLVTVIGITGTGRADRVQMLRPFGREL